MDYVKPADLASAMVDAGRSKLALPPLDLVILALYLTHKPRAAASAHLTAPTRVPAE